MTLKRGNHAFVLVTILLFCSCGPKQNKVFIEKHYKNGNVLSKRWYLEDGMIPIDTIYKFFDNGHLSSIGVYDSLGTGRLNGISILFYQNGKKYQVGNYVNGVAQGFYCQYDTNGILQTKQFYFDDKPVGDHFEFDKNGTLRKYTFYWTDSVYANYIEYDETGRIMPESNERPVLFNYFTNVRTDTSGNKIQKICKVSIIPSNPIRCRTKIDVWFFSENGSLLKHDSAENVVLYQIKDTFPESLATIKYTAVQYDSIIRKYYHGMFKTEL